MKRKTRKANHPENAPDESTDWLQAHSSVPCQDYTKASRDDLAADLEKGIQDLPVWKDYVRRFGLAEARNILRRGMVLKQITDGSPRN